MLVFHGDWEHFLISIESESEVAQSCPTLCNPVDCSPPGSSIHGILQSRVLECVAIAFSTVRTSLIFSQWVLSYELEWNIVTGYINVYKVECEPMEALSANKCRSKEPQGKWGYGSVKWRLYRGSFAKEFEYPICTGWVIINNAEVSGV